MKYLRESQGVPLGLPSPEWMLGIGALLIGTETELVLKSRFVQPKNLLREGFTFQYNAINKALSHLKK
jgi:NAD dependent epimerase/dehydratase family enzyme